MFNIRFEKLLRKYKRVLKCYGNHVAVITASAIRKTVMKTSMSPNLPIKRTPLAKRKQITDKLQEIVRVSMKTQPDSYKYGDNGGFFDGNLVISLSEKLAGNFSPALIATHKFSVIHHAIGRTSSLQIQCTHELRQ